MARQADTAASIQLPWIDLQQYAERPRSVACFCFVCVCVDVCVAGLAWCGLLAGLAQVALRGLAWIGLLAW